MLGPEKNQSEPISELSSGPHHLKIRSVEPLLNHSGELATHKGKAAVVILFECNETKKLHKEIFWTGGGGSAVLKKMLRLYNLPVDRIKPSSVIGLSFWVNIKASYTLENGKAVNVARHIEDASLWLEERWPVVNEEYFGEPETSDDFPDFPNSYYP